MGQDGRVHRQIADPTDGFHQLQGASKVILTDSHLEADAAEMAPRSGLAQTAQHLFFIERGPGDAGEIKGAGVTGARLGAEGTGHAATPPQHQIGRGRCGIHSDVSQAEDGGCTDGNVDLVCHAHTQTVQTSEVLAKDSG